MGLLRLACGHAQWTNYQLTTAAAHCPHTVLQDAFNHTGGRDEGPGGRWDDNGSGPDNNNNNPSRPNGPDGNGPQGGQQSNGPQGNGGQSGPQQDDGGSQGGGPQGGRGRNLKHSGDGGDDRGHGPGGPGGFPFPSTCPDVTLTEVNTPVDGSTTCSMGACLPCAGVSGCTCVDCRCSCA